LFKKKQEKKVLFLAKVKEISHQKSNNSAEGNANSSLYSRGCCPFWITEE